LSFIASSAILVSISYYFLVFPPNPFPFFESLIFKLLSGYLFFFLLLLFFVFFSLLFRDTERTTPTLHFKSVSPSYIFGTALIDSPPPLRDVETTRLPPPHHPLTFRGKTSLPRLVTTLILGPSRPVFPPPPPRYFTGVIDDLPVASKHNSLSPFFIPLLHRH